MPIFNQFVPHLRCVRKYCRREVLEENVIDAEMLKRIDFFRLSAVSKRIFAYEKHLKSLELASKLASEWQKARCKGSRMAWALKRCEETLAPCSWTNFFSHRRAFARCS